mgnify:CR=1 FL=1
MNNQIIEKKISPLEVDSSSFNSFLEEETLLKNIEGVGKLFLQNIDSFEKFKTILEEKYLPKYI